MPYDLLVKGGHVFDPGQGIDEIADIAVTDGRIAQIGPDLQPDDETRVMQLTPDRYVLPGLHGRPCPSSLRPATASKMSCG